MQVYIGASRNGPTGFTIGWPPRIPNVRRKSAILHALSFYHFYLFYRPLRGYDAN